VARSTQAIGLKTIGLEKVYVFLPAETDMRSDIRKSLATSLCSTEVNLRGIYLRKKPFLGQFKDTQRQGKGEMTFANGDKYTGDWVKGNRTGQGVHIFANGSRYEMRCSNITC
jgi:hypothetical protein